jgi:hypothetical protein
MGRELMSGDTVKGEGDGGVNMIEALYIHA